jgi:hypothetical protein
MAAGNWRETHQGIAFNRAGRLHDGQNRLNAVCDSGVTATFLVFFGAGDAGEMTVIDSGKMRTAVDAGHVLNLDITHSRVAAITQAARFARAGRPGNAPAMTHSKVLELVGRYGEAEKEVAGWFAGSRVKGVDRAPIRAAVLAAYATGVSADTLRRFVGVLCDVTPATEPGDSAPRLLRQFIANNLTRGASGHAVTADLYYRTAAAIGHAAAGTLVKVLRAPAESPFILNESV